MNDPPHLCNFLVVSYRGITALALMQLIVARALAMGQLSVVFLSQLADFQDYAQNCVEKITQFL